MSPGPRGGPQTEFSGALHAEGMGLRMMGVREPTIDMAVLGDAPRF